MMISKIIISAFILLLSRSDSGISCSPMQRSSSLQQNQFRHYGMLVGHSIGMRVGLLHGETLSLFRRANTAFMTGISKGFHSNRPALTHLEIASRSLSEIVRPDYQESNNAMMLGFKAGKYLAQRGDVSERDAMNKTWILENVFRKKNFQLLEFEEGILSAIRSLSASPSPRSFFSHHRAPVVGHFEKFRLHQREFSPRNQDYFKFGFKFAIANFVTRNGGILEITQKSLIIAFLKGLDETIKRWVTAADFDGRIPTLDDSMKWEGLKVERDRLIAESPIQQYKDVLESTSGGSTRTQILDRTELEAFYLGLEAFISLDN